MGARDVDRLVGRAVVDRPATRRRRSPSTSRGRSASVCGSWSASLKQGIWMMSFIGDDCLDLASGSIPKRRHGVLAPSAWAAPMSAHDGQGSMESATLTRLLPGPIRLARLRAAGPGAWATIGFGVLCVGALVGYFAFPTYPTYDSFYALLWGRDLLHLHLPDFSVYRAPTEHPLAIAFGMLLLDLRPGRRAPDGARLDRLVRGGRRRHLPARAPVLRPGRRAARGAARAEPLLRREPRGAGLPRHLLRRADRVGDRAGGRTAAARHAGLPRCSPPPACCARTRGC